MVAATDGTMPNIFKIISRSVWQEAVAAGQFTGAPVDLADGYIHLSTAAQVRETAARHFAGQGDLLLLAVDPARLGPELCWEPSRGGALFPHLYAALPLEAVVEAMALSLGPDGRHMFPDAIA